MKRAADKKDGPAGEQDSARPGQTVEGEARAPTAIVPYKSKIVEYNKTAEELAKLQAEYGGVVYPVATAKGMAAAKAARWLFVKLRTGLDAAHTEVKKEVLQRTKDIDGERRAILAMIEPLEKGIADQIDAEETRITNERLAKEKAEADRIAAEEKARKDAEEKALADQRAEIARQQAELDAKRAEQEARDKAAREAIAAEQLAAREKIERENIQAREKAHAMDMARQEIMGIQQQTIIAQQGRLGVRIGGTVECIEATLAETEAWPITAAQFGDLLPQAQQAKDHAVATIRGMLETARRQQAEEKRLAEARAKIEAEQAEARKAQEESARKAADESAARARADAEARHQAELKAQAEQQAKELAEQRAKEEAERIERQRIAAEKEKAAQQERETQRAAQELLDADQMLATFKERFGKLPRYATIIKAIDKLARGD